MKPLKRTIRKEIGEKIKSTRIDKKISLTSISLFLGISITEYAKIEDGKSLINLKDLEKISELLNTQVYNLVFSENTNLEEIIYYLKNNNSDTDIDSNVIEILAKTLEAKSKQNQVLINTFKDK